MFPASDDEKAGTVRTDVCVVGAGPAGLTFARRCIGSGFGVLVLEGGSYAYSEQADDLRSPKVISPYYRPDALANGRRRQFGGTANIWAHLTRPTSGRVYARALPVEAVDLEARAWQPSDGWPIGMSDLQPHYEQIARTWFGRSISNDPAAWATPQRPALPLRPGPLTTRIAQYGAADVFIHRYRDELFAADNVDVLVGGTVVELESDRGGAVVRRARVTQADGSSFHVEARVFVLAGGTVENVQTLLNSDATRPGGTGNRHGNIGHYITDHPEFQLGTLRPTDPGLLDQLGLYDLHYVDNAMVSGLLTLDQDFKRQEGLLNLGAVFVPRPAGFASDAERSLRSLRHALSADRRPGNALAHLRSVATSPQDSLSVLQRKVRHRFDHADEHRYEWHRGGWSRPGVDRRKLPVLELHVAAEQTAERDNCLTLTGVRDAVGRRQVQLRLRWSPSDQQNVLRSMQVLAAEIEGSGLGTFRRWIDFTGETRPISYGLHHPMGGTRMHTDPARGVVDENCRVHGTANLYVTGASVFPTGLGYVNPTLTILAISTRLADHVKALLGEATVTAPCRDDLTAGLDRPS